MNTKSFQSLCSKTALLLAGALTLAGVSYADKAAAINLNFGTVDTTFSPLTSVTNVGGANLGNGYSNPTIRYRNVGTDSAGQAFDAVVTASVYSTSAPVSATNTNGTYSFTGHVPNYRSANTTAAAGAPYQDAAFIYQINSGTGKGRIDYKMEFFTTTGGIHNYSTAYTAADLRFLVYDVDGSKVGANTVGSSTNRQAENLRIAKGAGLVGYQVGTGINSLSVTEPTGTNSYLFTGPVDNYAETDTTGAVVLYYQNVSSVTFGFEADTTTNTTGVDGVFSAIDGDLSLIAGQNLDLTVTANASAKGFSSYVSTASSTAAPEPFTIVGSILGGTAALRMRKKLKANTED
jgi:hypothetical protein